MRKKSVTIEKLAVMGQNGFEETRAEMSAGFKAVDQRFDKIEKLILADHKRRIKK
jgi:hypothetical protein